jgi:hypothetical protein
MFGLTIALREWSMADTLAVPPPTHYWSIFIRYSKQSDFNVPLIILLGPGTYILPVLDRRSRRVNVVCMLINVLLVGKRVLG